MPVPSLPTLPGHGHGLGVPFGHKLTGPIKVAILHHRHLHPFLRRARTWGGAQGSKTPFTGWGAELGGVTGVSPSRNKGQTGGFRRRRRRFVPFLVGATCNGGKRRKGSRRAGQLFSPPRGVSQPVKSPVGVGYKRTTP